MHYKKISLKILGYLLIAALFISNTNISAMERNSPLEEYSFHQQVPECNHDSLPPTNLATRKVAQKDHETEQKRENSITSIETVFEKPSDVTLDDVIRCYENIELLLDNVNWASLREKCVNFSEKLRLEEKEHLLNSMQIFRSAEESGEGILSAYYTVIVESAYTQEYSNFYKKVWDIWEDFCAKKVSRYYDINSKNELGETLLQHLWSKTGEGNDLYTDDEVEKLGEPFKIPVGDSLDGKDLLPEVRKI